MVCWHLSRALKLRPAVTACGSSYSEKFAAKTNTGQGKQLPGACVCVSAHVKPLILKPPSTSRLQLLLPQILHTAIAPTQFSLNPLTQKVCAESGQKKKSKYNRDLPCLYSDISRPNCSIDFALHLPGGSALFT